MQKNFEKYLSRFREEIIMQMTKIPTGKATTSMQNTSLFQILVVMCSAAYFRTLSCTTRRLQRSLHPACTSSPALRFLYIVILLESEQIQNLVKTTVVSDKSKQHKTNGRVFNAERHVCGWPGEVLANTEGDEA
jgi:hypothetical protein